MGGWQKQMLRFEVYSRAKGYCEMCGKYAPWAGPPRVRGHLAHKGHGAFRDDTPEGCLWKCYRCHIVLEHGGGKVVANKQGLGDLPCLLMASKFVCCGEDYGGEPVFCENCRANRERKAQEQSEHALIAPDRETHSE